MSRSTRVEQQQRTHQRLLEAGRVVLTRRGFLAATVEEIAAEAGYTRGAVYKHFGGKEGLWLAIIDARAEAHLRLLGEALERVSRQEELVAALTPAGFTDDEDAARWSRTTAEFAAAMTRLPEITEAAVSSQRRYEEQVIALLERHCQRLGIRPALPLAQAVVLLSVLNTSLALRRGVDPATDVPAIVANVLAIVFPE
ncbi:MAG TPA: helix-turn-helix domain-containing protein [Pseudonocardiaceae bacterium]|jgi:AcrR family transcriptional regulator